MVFIYNLSMINSEIISKIERQTNEMIARIKIRHPDCKAVYLPNYIPRDKVENIFIAMEPSFGRWSKGNESFAKEKISNGFKNFLSSAEDFCLHYSITNFLSDSYYVTDISKAAMTTANANKIRDEIYPECIGLLKEEIKEMSKPRCQVYFIGQKVEQWLSGEMNGKYILHYSGNASNKRNEKAKEYPEEYNDFSGKLRETDFLEFIDGKLMNSGIGMAIAKEIFGKFFKKIKLQPNSVLTDSRKKLIFTYYKEFNNR